DAFDVVLEILALGFAVELAHLLVDGVPHTGADNAGSPGVDGDVARGQFLGGHLSDAAHGELRGRVGTENREALDPGDRTGGDDLALVLAQLLELRRGGLDAVDHGVDVDAEDLLEVLRRDLVDRLDLHDTSIVGDDVEAAELFGRGVDCGEDLITLGDIGRDPDGSATEILDLLDHRAAFFLLEP